MLTVLAVVLLLVQISISEICNYQMIFHETYQYGYEITCNGLTMPTLDQLTNITIDNAIILKIQNSDLRGVTSELFTNFSRIKCLLVSDSVFEVTTTPLFSFPVHLDALCFDNVSLALQPRLFQGLSVLRSLSLTQLGLKLLDPVLFTPLKGLTQLDLSRNRLKDVSDVPFCQLPSLKSLNLSQNMVRNVSNPGLFCDQADVIQFGVNGHQVSINQNQQVQRTVLKLEHLDVSFNRIETIASLDWADGLKVLNLESNMLRNLNNDLLSWIDDLEEIDLRNNSLVFLDRNAFERCVKLRTLRLENNKLQTIFIENLKALDGLYLAGNELTDQVFENLVNLPSLTILDLRSNRLTGRFSSDFGSLQTLDLSGNSLDLLQDFNKFPNLKTLVLQDAKLQLVPSIWNLTKLQLLDLSRNQLGDIGVFAGLLALESLNLSSNYLKSLDREFFELLPKLQFLDISRNDLSDFNVDVFTTLPDLKVINMSSNPILCQNFKKILNYLAEKNIKFGFDKNQTVVGVSCTDVGASGLSAMSVVGLIVGVLVSILVLASILYRVLVNRLKRRDSYNLM